MNQHDFKEKDLQFHRQTARYYDDHITKVYRIYHSYSLHPFLDNLRDTGREMKMLDIGCGTGVVTLAIAARGIKVVGLDQSQEMIEIARQKALASNLLSSIQFEIGDVEKLRFKNSEFDGVTCQGLLHHLENMEPALFELHRVLKHEGVFYISEPCSDYTIIKSGMKKLWTAIRFFVGSKKNTAESGEAPICSKELFGILNKLGLTYEVEYLTHLPLLDKFLPDSLRLSITKMLSSPWRKKKGDIVFIYGQKP